MSDTIELAYSRGNTNVNICLDVDATAPELLQNFTDFMRAMSFDDDVILDAFCEYNMITKMENNK